MVDTMMQNAYSKNMLTTSIIRYHVWSCLGLLLLAVPHPARAQAGTDIFIAELTQSTAGIHLGPVTNVTRREGYDNQPSFSPDGRSLLHTSIRGSQADIWRYDLERGALVQVTDTPESEYSATVMPGGRTFSVIRVEMDSTQRLWQFELDGTNPKVIYERIIPVGYYAWIDASTTAMFILGRPATLQIGNVRSGMAITAASLSGRSLHKVQGENAVSCLHQVSEDEAWISEYDVSTKEIRRVVAPVDGSQDYVIMPTGTLLMGSGSKLFAWEDGWEDWIEVADFRGQIDNITRLAVSPTGDRIAIVGSDLTP